MIITGSIIIQNNAPGCRSLSDIQDACTPDPAKALNFDGVNDFAAIPAFDFYSSDFTIEGWINPERADGAVINGQDDLLGSGFDVQVSVFQTLRFFYRNPPGNAGGQNIFSTTNVVGGWHHFAAVYTADNRLKLYIDGVLEGTSGVISPLADGELSNFNIGFNVPTRPRFFKGAMDEFRIWDRELCEAEIQGRINCELAGDEDGLLTYYNFNQGVAGGDNASETTLLDQSGNGNNFALNNFALSGPTSNWIAPGAVATGTNCTTTPNCGVPPSIVCPTNIVAPNDPGQCSAVVNFVATDDAGVPPSIITYSQNPGTAFPVGTTTVTATATNTEGSDACSFKVTVNDNEAPQPSSRLQASHQQPAHLLFQFFRCDLLARLVPVVYPAHRRKDGVQGDGRIDVLKLAAADARLDDGLKAGLVVAAHRLEFAQVGFGQVAPLVVEGGHGGHVLGGHTDMQPDQRPDLFGSGAALLLHFFHTLLEPAAVFKTDGAQQLLLGADVVVQAGRFELHRLRQVAHGGG